MKLKIKNFQAIRSGEIEINPGLTLITGPTDNGKTAFFRGLLTLLTNPAHAATCINNVQLAEKNETAELSVTLIDDDIPKIEFHRTPTKAWYMIDGKKYSKLLRNNIFDIYPDLGKKFVYDPNDSRTILNFQTEDQLAFPFDKSDPEMFRLFERIFNISDTRTVIDTLKKEGAETDFKLERNQTEKATLEQKIEDLKQNISGINKEFLINYAEQFKRKYAEIQNILSKLNTISSYAPFLLESQNLPQFQENNGDETCNTVSILEKKLQEGRLKSAYIENYVDVAFTHVEEDFGSALLALGSKLSKIQTLAQGISEQTQLIQENEKIMQETEQKLSEFKICPLCGHELEE